MLEIRTQQEFDRYAGCAAWLRKRLIDAKTSGETTYRAPMPFPAPDDHIDVPIKDAARQMEDVCIELCGSTSRLMLAL